MNPTEKINRIRNAAKGLTDETEIAERQAVATLDVCGITEPIVDVIDIAQQLGLADEVRERMVRDERRPVCSHGS